MKGEGERVVSHIQATCRHNPHRLGEFSRTACKRSLARQGIEKTIKAIIMERRAMWKCMAIVDVVLRRFQEMVCEDINAKESGA